MVALLQFVLMLRESTRTLKSLLSGRPGQENFEVQAVVVLAHMLQLQAVLVVVLRLREGVSASVRTVEVARLLAALSPQCGRKEILKALETKTQEVKAVREQLDSLKRKSVEEEPEFKYKSNKKQFKFNSDVKDKFNQILERAGADDAITKIANEGMSLLDNRNKLISIADRDGWDVVEYFEADPLTKNDEEEKKLRVARKEAERSREKRNRKNSLRSKMGTRFKSQSTSSKSGPGANFGPSHRIVDFRPDVGQLLVNPLPEKKASVYRCFGCGKAGHFIKDCKVSSSAK